ncbi:SNF family Na+-dependent transporter [Geomicrobium halophilum]|uniref:SNF family Na+-dependent transporter n=1 Tax=Geomicrobium halophilum TaxID=549000 RepID=A0A841PY36_9BACL|nr:DUF2663 family protein [Geomicrobium halophilum]MBB6449005.1 SNF family Na+-dependent transporter [Geomicrobium halophilum]
MKNDKKQYMTPFAERIIRELIKRKKEEKKRERLVRISGWITTSACALILISLLTIGSSNDEITLFQMFTSNVGFIVVAICISAAAFLVFEKKKLDEAEKEYQELRNEVVDRYEEIWHTEQLRKQSYILYDWLEKEHDVNLFHR